MLAQAKRVHQSLRPNHTGPTYLPPVLVAVCSVLLMLVAQAIFRWRNADDLPSGYLLQDWSSDVMMQTLPLNDLIAFGPMALWYSHVYPPLQDSIRYLFALPEILSDEPISIMAVDLRLYVLYALAYGLVNAILFIWVRSLTGRGWWALGVTVVWALHPGYLTVMTLLDPSPLATLTISAALLLLYLFLRTRNLGYATGFFAVLVLASLSRSIVQVHVLVVVIVALVAFWFMAKQRNAALMAFNVVFVGLLFVMPIKMQMLYATWDSTSFGGYHRVGMLWIDPNTIPQPVPESATLQYQLLEQAREEAENPRRLAQLTPEEIRSTQRQYAEARRAWEMQRADYPRVDFTQAIGYPERIIRNALKFTASFNTSQQVLDNFRLGAAANAFITHQPIEAAQRLMKSVGLTLPEAFRPASEYTQNYFVESLPWRGLWDWMFSGWRYLLMIVGAAAVIVWRRGWLQVAQLLRRYAWFAVFYALLALPILLSNRYRPGEEELGPIWTDAMRQKVFLEIPVWAVLGYALWLVASRTGRKIRAKTNVAYG
jgi:hypothetical protein